MSSSGLISGTPTAGGTYNNVKFSYSDGTDRVCRSVNVIVGAIQIATTGPVAGAFPTQPKT